MLWTGGGAVPGVGAVETSRLTDEQKAALTVGQLLGTYTLEQARAWLEHLVNDLHFDQGFLVSAIVRAVDDELETQVEAYDRDRMRLRETARELEALLDDPEALARYNAYGQMHPLHIPGLPEPGDVTAADLRELLGRLQPGSAAPDERGDLQRRWQRWRELTAPIISRENIRRYREERLRRLGG